MAFRLSNLLRRVIAIRPGVDLILNFPGIFQLVDNHLRCSSLSRRMDGRVYRAAWSRFDLVDKHVRALHVGM